MAQNIVIATVRPWNVDQYRKWKPPVGFKKYLISSPETLTLARLKKLNPRYVFFPHWSWMIPPEIYEGFDCVVFHETDLPFGRGGSPWQNLIVRGIYRTRISAIRVVKELDAGPVYTKKPFRIETGSAQEIFERAAKVVFQMMTDIIRRNPRPGLQRGEAVVFRRRRPEESVIPGGLSARKLYDFIRMLDADGYPHAFLEHHDWHLEFGDAAMGNGQVSARVTFKKLDGKHKRKGNTCSWRAS